jgi:hypothetical protein
MKKGKVPPARDCDGKFLDVNFDTEVLARKVNATDFPEPREKNDPDSVILAYRSMIPIDKAERMAEEPGNENLLIENELDGLTLDGIACVCRGDVSSALDVHSGLRGGELSNLFDSQDTDEQ